MNILIATPIPEELAFLSDSLKHEGFHSEKSVLGRLPIIRFPEPGITLVQGGLGKVQFAIQVQHCYMLARIGMRSSARAQPAD